MYEELLKRIGLTSSEVKVYLALLRLESSTTGPIIKEAGIASGKSYLVLDKLIKKGLVTYVIRANVKHYHAKEPERLLDYLEEEEADLQEKKNALRKAIPALKAEFEEKGGVLSAEVFEGMKGFKTFYEWVLKYLKDGDNIDILGVPREANEKFQAYLLDWNNRRIECGIRLRILYNHDCRDFGSSREQMALTEVRYMKAELETPAWVDVFKDCVATINVHGEPVCFLIRNKESAESYRKYFEILWKEADRT